jgi:hypothetical protein
VVVDVLLRRLLFWILFADKLADGVEWSGEGGEKRRKKRRSRLASLGMTEISFGGGRH